MILGVVGAGTMGAGIAQLGCAARMTVLLHDPVEEALERGAERVRAGLAKWIEKGRAGQDSLDRLRSAASLDELSGCELVIEAAPERADLKRELFASLSKICGPQTVLATNTSSIPVTSLAGAAARPENVVGMHFFNPPPPGTIPSRISGWPNSAVSDATIMSHTSASSQPPPSA